MLFILRKGVINLNKKILNMLSDILIGGAAGVIVDYFVGTTFVFTVGGLIAGVVLALIINNKNKKG